MNPTNYTVLDLLRSLVELATPPKMPRPRKPTRHQLAALIWAAAERASYEVLLVDPCGGRTREPCVVEDYDAALRLTHSADREGWQVMDRVSCTVLYQPGSARVAAA